ncbi:6325_t:CDS:2 [Cetraspora pellucida]|uniref:6325_t:CDS:1 n=1 Tax=Cetraspora pellucida TaxID=1433469 RepID=A0ACA9LZS6_9GLOM|nr:6325_t:CDS:2 [Cetraspora pellucida]
MTDSNKNVLFNSIFADIHKELESLNNEISALQEIYLADYNSDEEFDNEDNELNVNETYDQIEQLHKINVLYPMHILMEDEKKREK